jgi:hypothetical protein
MSQQELSRLSVPEVLRRADQGDVRAGLLASVIEASGPTSRFPWEGSR